MRAVRPEVDSQPLVLLADRAAEASLVEPPSALEVGHSQRDHVNLGGHWVLLVSNGRELDERLGAKSTAMTVPAWRSSPAGAVLGQLTAPALEQPPLSLVVYELERAPVGGPGFVDATQPPQNLGTGGMQVAVFRQLEPVDDLQSGFWITCFRCGCRLVELDHRGPRQTGELAVEGRDLGPVGRLLRVQRRDRRLQYVRAAAAQGKGSVERRTATRELARVPQRSVLLRQQDEVAITEASPPARVVQQHQRHQAMNLGLVRHQFGEGVAEA